MDFIALGGANEVGASCYYIKLAGKYLLLDCGKGITQGVAYGPDFSKLYAHTDMRSLSQLDAVFISHAHYDHIAYLPVLADQCRGTPVYATDLTKALGKYLMWDSMDYHAWRNKARAKEEGLIDEALTRILPVGYWRSVAIDGVKASFYEAGHIPGASMIYFESAEKNILYTGDFMQSKTALTLGYNLPDSIKPDIIIMCALHAKHPHYNAYNGFEKKLPYLSRCIQREMPVYITVNQLTKGLEVVRAVTDKMQNYELPLADIFIDDNIWVMEERHTRMRILTERCHRFPTQYHRLPPGIYIGAKEHSRHFANAIDPHFSLHANYHECVSLIAKYAPAAVFVVHAPDDRNNEDNFALQSAFPDIKMIYPIQGHIYNDYSLRKEDHDLKTNTKKNVNDLVSQISVLISKVSKEQRQSFTNENNLLCVGCEYPEGEPRQVAELYNKRYAGNHQSEPLDGDAVIRIFRRCELGHVANRKKLFAEAAQTAEMLVAVIVGQTPLSNVAHIAANLDGHVQKKRLILMMTVSKCKKIRESEAYGDAMRMNKDFAAECLDAIIHTISKKSQKPTKASDARHSTIDAYQQKINDLEIECSRANNLLRRLQESFDTQLAESKVEEQIRFISMLNSEKYGYVLDLMVSAQRGFKSLRSQQINIPYELKDVQALVRRLLEFTEDCNVTPMMAIGTKMHVRATDIEGYTLDGKPFAGEDEIKYVEVVSPGWQIEHQDIVISYPRLKEIVEE